MFGDIEIGKQKFHYCKSSVSIYDVGINKIVVSTRFTLQRKLFKYFIGYKNDEKFGSLCLMLLKMSACKIFFDETNCITFLIKDDELLEK